MLISHRGVYDKNNIKENTKNSIINAFNSSKYVGCEFDIRLTKDNVFVLYHDPLFDNKLISNLNYIELAKYVPTLEEILSINTDKIFLIEIKNIRNEIDKLVDLLNKYNKNIYVMSFNSKLIDKISKKDINFKVGVLNYILNTSSMTNLDFVCILDSIITDDIVNIFKENNKEVISYGIINKNNIGKRDIYYIVDE